MKGSSIQLLKLLSSVNKQFPKFMSKIDDLVNDLNSFFDLLEIIKIAPLNDVQKSIDRQLKKRVLKLIKLIKRIRKKYELIKQFADAISKVILKQYVNTFNAHLRELSRTKPYLEKIYAYTLNNKTLLTNYQTHYLTTDTNTLSETKTLIKNSLDNLKTLIPKFNSIFAFLVTIESEMKRFENKIIFNFDSLFPEEHLTREAVLYIDTSFLVKLYEHLYNEKTKSKFIPSFISSATLMIPSAVLEELSHVSSKTNTRLVSAKFVSYIKKEIATINITPAPTEEEKFDVYKAWRAASIKANALDGDKFYESADIQLLILAMRIYPKRITILTDDNEDIKNTGNKLKVNVNVINSSELLNNLPN